MIGGEEAAVDWRWPERDNPTWRMSSKEGIRWSDDGPLNEFGRKMILRHFGLESIAPRLPLEKINDMSPATLLKRRRELERRRGLQSLGEPTSSRPGGDILASLAA